MEKMDTQKNVDMRRDILMIVGGLAASAAAIWLIQTLHFVSWDFRNNLWAPAHLLLSGQSPYNVSVLFDNSRAVWLPMGPGLFFMLGWLTQYQATNVWLLGNLVALIEMIWLAAGTSRPQRLPFAISLLLVLLFPATVSHLMLGQFAIVTTLVLLLAASFIRGPRLWPVGFLVAVALTKPQLAILGVSGILIYLIGQHGWRKVGIFLGACALWVLVLTLPLWLAYPAWFDDFRAALNQNPVWAQPALFSVLPRYFGPLGLMVWLLLALSVFIVSALCWLRGQPEDAMVWSLALTPLVSPYVWSWDFVLILPLLVRSVFGLKARAAQAWLGLGYLLCWGSMVWIRVTTENSDERFWWLPPALLFVLVGGCAIQTRTTKTISSRASI